MKESPLVTIAIPIFNAAPFLADCIQSVLNQTYSNFELLLLNDGSTDESLSIINQFSDPRIIVHSDGENKGLVYRLNQSIDLAKGEYYSRMDADDIMHFDKISKQVNFLRKKCSFDVVGTFSYSIDIKNDINGILSKKEYPTSNMDVIRNKCFIHPTIMGKTDWFRRYKYTHKAVRMEDYDLWMRSIHESSFCNIKEPLFFYREAGLPTLKKYLMSQKGIFRLCFDFKKITPKERCLMLLGVCAKCFIYGVASLFGTLNFILKLRSSSLDIDIRQCAIHYLNKSISMEEDSKKKE